MLGKKKLKSASEGEDEKKGRIMEMGFGGCPRGGRLNQDVVRGKETISRRVGDFV